MPFMIISRSLKNRIDFLFMIQMCLCVALFFAPIRERIAFSLREAMAQSTVRLLSPVFVAMDAIEQTPQSS